MQVTHTSEHGRKEKPSMLQGQGQWLGGMEDFWVSEGLFPGLSGSFLCENH